jgi:hypothetical protein
VDQRNHRVAEKFGIVCRQIRFAGLISSVFCVDYFAIHRKMLHTFSGVLPLSLRYWLEKLFFYRCAAVWQFAEVCLHHYPRPA